MGAYTVYIKVKVYILRITLKINNLLLLAVAS